MRRKPAFDKFGLRPGHILLAVMLGATAGLFVSGYWLIDLFPAESRWLAAISALAGATASIGYLAVFRKVEAARASIDVWRGARLGALGALLAAFLFFAGTSQWQKPGRYIGFLLPRESFKLTSIEAPQGTAITWMNTSLGDVSYDGVRVTGWDRRADQLILSDPQNNALEWRGRAGERMEIVFASPGAAATFEIEWGDEREEIRLGEAKTSYVREFRLPILASRQVILALGLLNFWALSVSLLIAGRGLLQRAPNNPSQSRKSPGGGKLQRSELLALAAIAALALALRVFNLGAVFPAVDEYYHLIAANQLLDGAAFDSVYPRGLWIVTVPIAAALGTLGHDVGAARAIGAIFNVLALVPLYLLTRRVNRVAAIVVCTLYATSPWIITFARVAREYAYYPLYFFLVAFAMVALVEAVPAGFVVTKDLGSLWRPKVVGLALFLLLPPIFALEIDWLSTFRTILIAYLVLGTFLLGRINWRARANLPMILAAVAGIAAMGWFFYREQLSKLLLIPRINPVPLNYFFPNPPQQWYFDRVGLLVALGVAIAVAAAWTRRRESMVPLFFVCLFGAYLAVFALFSRSFFHTRHLISTQFWFIAVAGFGLSWLWEWLRGSLRWKGGAAGMMIAVGLGALVLNPGQVLLPTLSREADMPISEDYLHDMTSVQAYMLRAVHEDDVLVSTVYGLYATWEGAPRFAHLYRINAGTSSEELASIVSRHEAGWIVIDSIRLDMSAVSERTLTSMPQLEYIGAFGDEHVWRWGQPLAGSPAREF